MDQGLSRFGNNVVILVHLMHSWHVYITETSQKKISFRKINMNGRNVLLHSGEEGPFIDR